MFNMMKMMVVFVITLTRFIVSADRSKIITSVTHTITHTTHINHRIVGIDDYGSSMSANIDEQNESDDKREMDQGESVKEEYCTDIPSLEILADASVTIPSSFVALDFYVYILNFQNTASEDPPSCLLIDSAESSSAHANLAVCREVVYRKWQSLKQNKDSNMIENDVEHFTANLKSESNNEVLLNWLKSSGGSKKVCVGWHHFEDHLLITGVGSANLTLVQKQEYLSHFDYSSAGPNNPPLSSVSVMETTETSSNGLKSLNKDKNIISIHNRKDKLEVEKLLSVSSPSIDHSAAAAAAAAVVTSFQSTSNLGIITRTVSVDSLFDSAPNISLCSLSEPDQQLSSSISVSSGECNFRSAVEMCTLFLSSNSCVDVSATACIVLLPPMQAIIMDPVFGEMIISDNSLCGILSVEGSGCVIHPSSSTPLPMRLLHVDMPASSNGWFSLRIDNIVIENFGDYSVEGGALRLNNFISILPSSVTNVVLRNNSGSDGGALAVSNSGTVVLGGVVFERNTARGDAGGLFIDSGCENINITDCSFNYNTAMGEVNSKPDNAGLGGGALINSQNTLISLNNCTFFKNTALRAGGLGFYENNNRAALTDVHFSNNTALIFGGGLFFVSYNRYATLTKCYFLGNIGGIDSGGLGVFNYNDFMTLIQCVFFDNSASGEGGNARGGGIYLSTNNVYFELQNCTFSGNSASSEGGSAFGGGIYSDSCDGFIKGCLFSGNSASSESTGWNGGAFGGGIYLSSYNYFTLEGCLFSGNSASSEGGGAFGGGIYLGTSNTNFILRDSLFSGNAVANGGVRGGMGGGMYVFDGNHNMQIEDCHFSSNSASSEGEVEAEGGGIYLGNNNDNFDCQNCHFSGNIVRGNTEGTYGGGIYVGSSHYGFTLLGCHFSGNRVTGQGDEAHGGGIFFGSSNSGITLQDCVFSGNSVQHEGQGQSAHGGGIFFDADNVFIRFHGCLFSGNSASNAGKYGAGGGGIYFLTAADGIEFQDCNFTGNSVSSVGVDGAGGGGLYLGTINIEFTLQNCYFFSNTASSEDGYAYGGGIYLGSNNDLFTLENCTFSSNSVRSEGGYAYGGGMYLGTDNSDLRMQGCSFLSNSVISARGDALGGGLFLFSSNFYMVIQVCHFSSNSASSEGEAWGGGMYMFTSNFHIIIEDCYFYDNSAGTGGALCLNAANNNGTLRNVTCRDNVARDNGGGIALVSGNYFFTVNDSSLTGNTAGALGGGLYSALHNNGLRLVNSHVTRNLAGSAGGGIYIGESHRKVSFDGVEISENTAVGTAGGAYFVRFSSDIIMSACQIRNNSAGTVGGLMVLVDDMSIKFTVFEHNVAHGNFGALYVQSSNYLEVDFSNFSSNFAQGSCGAMSMSQTGRVTVNNSLFLSNIAESGAAVCVDNGSKNTSFVSVDFRRNVASTSAGALLLLNAIHVLIDLSSFTDNGALSGDGSALYISASTVSLLSNSFVGNEAPSGGGTVFWESLSGMQEPFGLTGFGGGNFFSASNIAGYGGWYATEARYIVPKYGETLFEVVDYDATTAPPLTVMIHDWYNQTVLSDSSSSVAVAVSASTESDCYGSEGFVGGVTSAYWANGSASFDLLEPVCAPTYNLSLVVVSSLSSVASLPFLYSFRECYRGEYYAERICNPCSEGSYSFVHPSTLSLSGLSSDICQQCPSGAKKCFQDQIIVEKGHWRRYEISSAVLTCPLLLSCIGGNETGNGLCATGYEGPLCNICSYNYFLSEGECLQCSSRSSMFTPTFYIYMILFLITMSFLSYYNYLVYNTSKLGKDVSKSAILKLADWLGKQKNKFFVRLKIIITTYQVVSAVSSTLVVSMPKSFSTFADILGFLNLNVMNAFNVDCFRKTSFIDILLLNTLMPIGASVVLAFCFGCEFIFQQKNSQIYNDLKDKYLNLFFYLTYLVLPGVSTQIFQMFVCTNVDPDSEDNSDTDTYLTADMSISCESDYYRSGFIYARNIAPVSPTTQVDISNPLVSNEDNRSSERENNAQDGVSKIGTVNITDMPDSCTRLRFLWGSYAPSLWYWEIVETYRRLALTAFLSVCGSGTSKQAVLSVVLSIFFIKLYNWKSPYLDKSSNILADVGMFQIFFSFFAALCIQNSLLPDWNAFLGVFLIWMNFSVIYLSLYYQFKAHSAGAKLKANKDDEMVLNSKNDVIRTDNDTKDEEKANIWSSDIGSLPSFDSTVQSKQSKAEGYKQSADNIIKDEFGASRGKPKLTQQRDSNKELELTLFEGNQGVIVREEFRL